MKALVKNRLVLAVGVLFGAITILDAQTIPQLPPASQTNSLLQNPAFAGLPLARAAISEILATPAPAQTLPVVAVQAASPSGTYWSLQLSGQPPLPMTLGVVNESRGAESDLDWSYLAQTYTIFFNAWMSGYPLEDCIDFANTSTPSAPFVGSFLNFPFELQFSWVDRRYHGALPTRLKIIGYAGITRNGFVDGYDNAPHTR